MRRKEAAKTKRLLESALGIKSKRVLKEMNGNNLGVSVVARKKLSAKDAVDPVASDHEVESPPAKKPKLDYERIIMYQELSDTPSNY